MPREEKCVKERERQGGGGGQQIICRVQKPFSKTKTRTTKCI